MLRSAILVGLLAATAEGATAESGAADIGFAGPLSGPFAVIGRQMNAGVIAASGSTVVAEDDSCTAEGGKAAAEALIAAKIRIVVGFACTEALDAALPLLSPAGIPVVTPAVRATHVADQRIKTRFLFFRLAPRADAEALAAARLLKARWGDDAWAVVDDGAPSSRALAESFRFAMEENGLKASLAETFRPAQENQAGLVRRILTSGARHAFIAGERGDVAVIAASSAELAAKPAGQASPLDFAGGESLRGAPDGFSMPDGVFMASPPDWSTQAAPDILAAIRTAGAEPEGYAVSAYAAAQVALEALATGGTLAEALSSTLFSTAVGPVSFDAKGDWKEDPWMLTVSQNQKFVPLGEP